ncbi:MAG TPA: PaaI family thioesterase [Terriglobales bacterium]|nr:PaaI family thioesterase [Terriglobales bacterium]
MKESFGSVFPVADFLGMRLVSQGDGRAVATLEATEKHANPMGTLHGGILCDLTDAAMGVAFASTLTPDESFTTLELKINFLRPFWKGLLTAEAEITSRGRTIGLLTCKVVDEKKRLIASATSTCMVLAGDAAKNR